jgi:hypothetical protein
VFSTSRLQLRNAQNVVQSTLCTPCSFFEAPQHLPPFSRSSSTWSFNFVHIVGESSGRVGKTYRTVNHG